MKITWKNIDNFKLTKTGRFSQKGHIFVLVEDGCKNCGDIYFSRYNKGKYTLFCSLKCSQSGKNNSMYKKKGNWKGGYSSNNIPRYDTYTKQLEPYGIKCKRNKKDSNILEVKCIYCDKWYIPKLQNICDKIKCINGNQSGENNLYCSDKCKQECPTYKQIKYPKGFKKNTSREVQPTLRKLVLKRDNYTCQKCHTKENGLHCHHYEGVEMNPIESADIDNCITLCKKCHNIIHTKEICGMNQYKRRKC